MATEEKMNEEEILNIYYSNAEEKYLIYDDQILCSNHVLSVKDLFIIDKSCPIICLMWNLIFSLTENEIIHIANIINPIESKILNSIQRMFDSISLENIQEIFYWNKWACGFDSFIPTITNCMIKSIDKTYEYPYAEIDSLLLNIKNAIDYLNKVICAYWSSKDLIKLCKVKYDYLNELKIQKNKLNIKFDIMIQHIASKEINKEYFEMKNNIIKLINKNKTNLTDENYIKIKKVLDQFILEATSKNENKKNSDIINWPPQKEPQNDNETKNIKILKSLILYSEIKRLLSEIKDNKKIFYNLLILKNHPKLSISWKYLLKIIIFQSAENEYKSLFNSLDANLIVELFNIDNTLITYPNHLYDVINDYSKRKPCEEIEIQWIYKMIKKFSSDFLITIPQFYPNSIISLIVNKRDDKKYQYGPLLCFIDDLDQQILEEQFRLMNKNFHKFRHAAKSIAQVMYNSIYDKNKIAPQKFKKLKEFFEHNSNIGNNYKSKISSQMKNLFLIAESLDKWTKPKLIYDDFIYESAQKHFTKYPSLLFWVCKNKKCAMQLKNLNENIRFNSEEIPLWMIYFRFLSSEQILCFEPASENKLYDIINTAIRNTIIHYKNAFDEPKSNMSFEWINLLVSKPPHKIANKNIKMIHDFLVNFIDENDINDDGLIYKCIYGTISNLTELILSIEKNKFLDKHVSSKSLIQFLCYPSQYFSFKLYDGESSGISSCQNILDLSKTSAPLPSYSFSELTNLDYLSQPILFVSSTSKITCSMNELKINIGPIFPSICISPITINILNFISGKASASIENLEDPQNYQSISIDEKVEKSHILHIFIYPHKIKSKSKDSILLKGNINIKVKNYEDFRLPFLINLLLLPIKVEVSCIQYSLFKHSNNIYQINCFEVKPNEQIDFEVININDHDLFILRADLESLDNNESDKPIITLDKKPKLVSLKIPQVDKSTKCKFNLIIKFSKYIETKIICDFVIQPYTVAFEVYDYCTEEFTSDACRIFLSKPNPKQTFYFRINTLSQSNQKCKISYKLPNPIKIDRTDLNSFNEFYVNELFSFNIAINNLSSKPDFNDNNDYGIALEIEKKIKKTIKFEFIHTNNEQLDHINKNSEQNNIYLSKYPCYLYQNDLNKWQRISNYSDIPDYKDKSVNPYIITSPFRFYSNANEFIQINYNLNNSNIVNVTNQSNFHIKYIQISPNNTINNEIIKISSTIKSKTTVKTGKFMGLMNNKTTINYYSIIGFVEEKPELWFPLIDQYPNIQGKQLLSYENQNYRIASAFISDINKIQNQNNTFRNSALLFNLLNNEKIFHNINSIIEQFPVCFRNRFSNLLRDINKYLILPKIEKNIHEIILYNLLISFLQIFSERIEEIKYLQCNLIMPLSSDKIKLQIKKSHDSLMFYNSILAKSKKINDSQFLIAKENCINIMEMKKKTNQLNKFNSIIVNEYNNASNFSHKAKAVFFDDPTDGNRIFLPPINVPQKVILSKYCHFFSLCSEGAILLPAFINDCLRLGHGIDIAEEYFDLLFAIYKCVNIKKYENKSIFAEPIDDFLLSCKLCLHRLKLAGINLFNDFDDIVFDLPNIIELPQYTRPLMLPLKWEKT